ncbi:hypothetical protein RFI_10402 [Reticulomyxa filosa]|uniref:Uncharacterized protein n=1 Tax=Reticulomyxa filosa TaxID=46433 RepID=X6NL60_RETFI|nr:hypothetical protein RFI_10402 [Reticulomyxa filosa]|eukprot:ETO26731.1 hypothetical protein RFI_10402 [Reticulomyxa filosa]
MICAEEHLLVDKITRTTGNVVEFLKNYERQNDNYSLKSTKSFLFLLGSFKSLKNFILVIHILLYVSPQNFEKSYEKAMILTNLKKVIIKPISYLKITRFVYFFKMKKLDLNVYFSLRK